MYFIGFWTTCDFFTFNSCFSQCSCLWDSDYNHIDLHRSASFFDQSIYFIWSIFYLMWSIYLFYLWVCAIAQSCLTLCSPMDCSLPGFSVHGIFQARILEWFAISSSQVSSWPRDWAHISSISCIVGRILYHSATWEAHFCYIFLLINTNVICWSTFHKDLGKTYWCLQPYKPFCFPFHLKDSLSSTNHKEMFEYLSVPSCSHIWL